MINSTYFDDSAAGIIVTIVYYLIIYNNNIIVNYIPITLTIILYNIYIYTASVLETVFQSVHIAHT